MLLNKITVICFLLLISFQLVNGQEDVKIKFGKISQADFQATSPKFDSGANAVILADIGKTTFVGNETGSFSIVYTRTMRVKIINKNGFGIADYKIYLYNDRAGTSEKITQLKGSTFNLENGTVQESKLDETSVFNEKSSRYHDVTKFTMPGLKAGSVYDLTYTIKTNFFSTLRTWRFQHEYPCLWSEYDVVIPVMYHYLVKTHGDSRFDIQNTTITNESYSINDHGGGGGYASPSSNTSATEMYGVTSPAINSRWVKKNVPALTPQPYMSTLDNYLSKIEFEFSYYKRNKDSERYDEIISWDSLSHFLLINEGFGFELNKDNPWMDDELKSITEGSINPTEELKRIYHFVRDNFHCTDYSDIFVYKSLKDVYKKRAGNAGELNLLLIAMLKHKNIFAEPVILSTRRNGISTKDYPLIDEYNYLVCFAQTEGKIYKLDASSPFNSFGKLPSYCYNWNARTINDDRPSTYVYLCPDSIFDVNTISARFINDEKGRLSGSVKAIFSDALSSDIREKIKKNSSKEYIKTLEVDYPDLTISNATFDSLGNPDYPLILNYDLDFKDSNTLDVLYFNPIFSATFKTNPFTATQRFYPIEMDSKIDYTYLLNMEIPKGYQVDELPKSARVNFNENQGVFEYLIQQSPDVIQMKVRLKFNQADFPTEEYGNLRDFFAFVVKKEGEQIVFKKIK